MQDSDERAETAEQPELNEEGQDDQLLDTEGIAIDPGEVSDVVGATADIAAVPPSGRDAESRQHERRAKRRRRHDKPPVALPDDLAEPLEKLRTKDSSNSSCRFTWSC